MRNLVRFVVAFALGLSGLVAGAPSASAVDVGFVGPSYSAGSSAPTAQKPQSKLWFAQGTWWGALWDNTSRDFHIFRYNSAGNTWVDTGSLVETRSSVNLDVLYDNGQLYVVSAGKSTTSPDAEFSRYSYNAAQQTWTRDAGFPVRVATGLTYSPVIARDNTGLLWVTYTTGTRVMLTHSTLGSADRTWVTPYQLPTPNANQASTVSHNTTNDPGSVSSDISTVVSYDGNKVGVLWSNQVTDKMYFASHSDGAGDRTWSLVTAYDQPEGADDHINLKAVVGLPGGRVFAVAKTSKNGASEPLINLLSMSGTGAWTSDVFSTVAENMTRATLLIDSQNQELYVFASGPCCSGGNIFYKKKKMSVPGFGARQVFMESAANPKLNNATSTKQTVNAASGIMVLAGDDSTRRYFYNRMSLGSTPPPGPDTTPPDTTITSGPTGTTASASATFEFSANEASTFQCRLDAQAFTSCVSPRTYTGLAAGSHTFSVQATDTAGNPDASPATRTWTVDLSAPTGAVKRETVATTVNTTAVSSLTVGKPAGTADGDVLVSCLALNGGRVGTAPAGWTSLASVTAISNPKVFGYYRVVGAAAEPASYTWTLSGSVANSGGIARYSGVRAGNPLAAGVSTATGAAATSATVPGVTTGTAGSMLVGCMGANTSSAAVTITAPSGLNAAWNLAGKRQQLADGTQAAAGASGAKSWQLSSAREWAGWLTALAPRP